MLVLSTNISQPRTMHWNGESITSGIFKEPVDSISIKKFFVEGDCVANKKVHGGERKAVYAYPSEHYEFWRNEFSDRDLPWGMFGENITTQGLFENDAIVGSRYRFGAALLQVTQPRFPCSTLAMKFESKEMIKRFLLSRRSGIYFTVIEEGVVRPGDSIVKEHGGDGVSIGEMVEERIRRE